MARMRRAEAEGERVAGAELLNRGLSIPTKLQLRLNGRAG